MGYFYYYYFIPYNQNSNLKVTPANVIQNTNKQGTLNTDTEYYLIQNEAIQYPTAAVLSIRKFLSVTRSY
jgi:hypothetical protein